MSRWEAWVKPVLFVVVVVVVYFLFVYFYLLQGITFLQDVYFVLIFKNIPMT